MIARQRQEYRFPGKLSVPRLSARDAYGSIRDFQAPKPFLHAAPLLRFSQGLPGAAFRD